ncbi:MAG TPA: hypothetical protein VM009_04000 [Terriglobales bacterium]|nr:hypothetical protein [Terriglobales bacterium]
MRLAVAAIFLSSLTVSISAQSNVPTKEDPKGFSKEAVEELHKQPRSEFGDPKTYTPPPPQVATPPAVVPEGLEKVVAAQFGPDCKIAMKRSNLVVNYRVQTVEAWTPFQTADLDNDGVQDAIIVARCKNALGRKDEFSYDLIDPYMAYHGYGDPKITSEISSDDPMQGHAVLIIHGAGADAWRAEKPKSKFVAINLPFSNIGVTRVVIRKGKPAVGAVLLQEGETMSSVLFWDGKKYKWRDSIGNQ